MIQIRLVYLMGYGASCSTKSEINVFECFAPARLRWYVSQIYVSSANEAVASTSDMKVNKKGGTTVSVKKVGGWQKAWEVAKSIGSWESKPVQRQKKTKAS